MVGNNKKMDFFILVKVVGIACKWHGIEPAIKALSENNQQK